MTDTKMKIFISNLRRVLYLSQIMQYNLESLRECELCPSYLKMDAKGIANAIGRLNGDMSYHHPQAWQDTKNELLGDKVHNLSLLLEAMHDVDNVEEITNIILSQKEIVA